MSLLGDSRLARCSGRLFGVGKDKVGPQNVHILIAQPNMDGHRFNYVRILADHAQRFGVSVTILTTEAGRQRFLSMAPGRDDLVQVLPHSDFSLRTLKIESRRRGATNTIVPDGDRLVLELVAEIGWWGQGDLTLLIMRSQAPLGLHWAKRVFLNRAKAFVHWLSASQRSVHLLKLVSATDPRGKDSGYVGDPVTLAPDPLFLHELEMQVKQVDVERPILLVAGAISMRKSIPLLHAALARIGTVHRPVTLVLAGRQSPDVRDYLDGVSTLVQLRVLADDRELSDGELDAYITWADAVLVVHTNEGPSGILAKAVLSGTKVAAAGALTLREDAKRVESGIVWSPLNLESLSEGIARVLLHDDPSGCEIATEESFAQKLTRTRVPRVGA